MIQVGDIAQVVKSRWIPLGTLVLVTERKVHGMNGNEFLHATLLNWSSPHERENKQSVRLKGSQLQIVSAVKKEARGQ